MSTVVASPVHDELGEELAHDRGVLEPVAAEAVREVETRRPGASPTIGCRSGVIS